MTGIAVHHSMGADQRETVLVLVDGMNGHFPAVDSVAEVALRSILPSVQIGVAILAVAPYVGKRRIDVTLLARHSGMHTAQGVTGSAVIEFRLAANRTPGRGTVTLLTSYVQHAMRTVDRSGGRGLRPGRGGG